VLGRDIRPHGRTIRPRGILRQQQLRAGRPDNERIILVLASGVCRFVSGGGTLTLAGLRVNYACENDGYL
jgi:hypothetical protein